MNKLEDEDVELDGVAAEVVAALGVVPADDELRRLGAFLAVLLPRGVVAAPTLTDRNVE